MQPKLNVHMWMNFSNFSLWPEEVPINDEENEANNSPLEKNIDKPAEEKGEINSEKETSSSENQERPPTVDNISPQASPPHQEESREEGPKVIELDKDKGEEEAPDWVKEEAPKEDGNKNKFDDFEVPAIVSREPPPMTDEEDSTESEKTEQNNE